MFVKNKLNTENMNVKQKSEEYAGKVSGGFKGSAIENMIAEIYEAGLREGLSHDRKDMEYDTSKFTHIGSMNYIVQAWYNEEEDQFEVDQYQPRRNRIWHGMMDSDDAKQQIEETIERMKLAINQFQELLDGKRTNVYYWEEDDPRMSEILNKEV